MSCMALLVDSQMLKIRRYSLTNSETLHLPRIATSSGRENEASYCRSLLTTLDAVASDCAVSVDAMPTRNLPATSTAG